MIPFNKPYYQEKTINNLRYSLKTKHISGDGFFNEKVTDFFKQKYGFNYSLTTTSCTDALELISLTIDIKKGDEIIIPNFTFVSTANAFILRGAKIIFADSYFDNPNIDLKKCIHNINSKTKAILIVHYAGSAYDLDQLIYIKKKFPRIKIIEDAAQCINSFYNNKPLGLFGDFAAFSFHETKNISCGEGGLFVCKSEKDYKKAEIIREKGTNRKSFIRNEVDKYGWKKVGSSFLPSDILMSILYSQLEKIDEIQIKRNSLWEYYYNSISKLNLDLLLPRIDNNSNHNSHIFYVVLKEKKIRDKLQDYLKRKNIIATSHYTSLYTSEYFRDKKGKLNLPNSERFSDCILRLPLFHELTFKEIDFIVYEIESFLKI